MTKYRAVSNGHYDELEYERETHFLFFKLKSWRPVWRPYYDEIWGRQLGFAVKFINETNTNLKNFTTKWPDIKKYFEWAFEEQEELEEKVNKERAEREARKQDIKYF